MLVSTLLNRNFSKEIILQNCCLHSESFAESRLAPRKISAVVYQHWGKQLPLRGRKLRQGCCEGKTKEKETFPSPSFFLREGEGNVSFVFPSQRPRRRGNYFPQC